MTKVKTPSSQSPFSAVIIFVFALGSAIEAVVTHPDPQVNYLMLIFMFEKNSQLIYLMIS